MYQNYLMAFILHFFPNVELQEINIGFPGSKPSTCEPDQELLKVLQCLYHSFKPGVPNCCLSLSSAEVSSDLQLELTGRLQIRVHFCRGKEVHGGDCEPPTSFRKLHNPLKTFKCPWVPTAQILQWHCWGTSPLPIPAPANT